MYEVLLSTAYGEGVEVVELPFLEMKGLYCDRVIGLKKEMPSTEKACVLAEELGHLCRRCPRSGFSHQPQARTASSALGVWIPSALGKNHSGFQCGGALPTGAGRISGSDRRVLGCRPEAPRCRARPLMQEGRIHNLLWTADGVQGDRIKAIQWRTYVRLYSVTNFKGILVCFLANVPFGTLANVSISSIDRDVSSLISSIVLTLFSASKSIACLKIIGSSTFNSSSRG